MVRSVVDRWHVGGGRCESAVKLPKRGARFEGGGGRGRGEVPDTAKNDFRVLRCRYFGCVFGGGQRGRQRVACAAPRLSRPAVAGRVPPLKRCCFVGTPWLGPLARSIAAVAGLRFRSARLFIRALINARKFRRTKPEGGTGCEVRWRWRWWHRRCRKLLRLRRRSDTNRTPSLHHSQQRTYIYLRETCYKHTAILFLSA